MKELRCPHCGQMFTVDEADYASIVGQVRNAEFDAEIERRIKEMDDRQKAQLALASAEAEQKLQSQLSKVRETIGAKDAELERLRGDANLSAEKIRAEKEAEIARLKTLLENAESRRKNLRAGTG